MTRDAAIHHAIDAALPGVRRVAGGGWTFAITNGTATAARAQVDGDWLVLTADAPSPAGGMVPDAWSMLAWNGTLTGGARFVVGAATPAPGLRAEIVLDADADLGCRVTQACRGLREAIARLHEPGVRVEDPPPAAVADDGGALASLCRETRWSVKERGPGSLAVDLDVPGGFHQALVEQRAAGRVSLSVPVLDPTMACADAAPVTCRHALGIFLMRLGGVVRMARAAVESAAGATPRFEVVYEQPTGGELVHGFIALSMACRLGVREAAALRHDEAVARVYVRQWDDALGRRTA